MAASNHRQSKRAARMAQAREMRAAGHTYEEIGEQVGTHWSTAWRWLNPEAAAAAIKRDNARRNLAKQEWAKQHDRGSCGICGAPMGVGTARQGSSKCMACRDELRREKRMEKARRIERLWARGATIAEIAADLGTTPGTIGVEVTRLRREGLADLPYRYGSERRAA